jgi:excisionase family DNA binding protein
MAIKHTASFSPPKSSAIFQNSEHDVLSYVRLLSLKGAATYLGVSYWGLRGLVLNGQLPSVRVGRRILLDIRDLEAFIERNKQIESF